MNIKKTYIQKAIFGSLLVATASSYAGHHKEKDGYKHNDHSVSQQVQEHAESHTKSVMPKKHFPADIHAPWDNLLKAHVKSINDGNSTAISYAGVAQERNVLTTYLKSLSDVPVPTFESWSKEDQLAFLINAYNAYTVNLILEHYPKVESIRDIGSIFKNAWKQKVAPLLGEIRTLDGIEHGIIRGSGDYNEPRIHFAVNCASIGCPSLRGEAYIGSKIDMQLDEQTRQFLGDSSRNILNGHKLSLSKIFDWYGDDFETGWRGLENLESFIAFYGDALHLSDTDRIKLSNGDINIKFNKYDWSLNDYK